ncbi:MAG TPA: response regulator [Rhodanobacteraceae bacterium]|nr:response regulator [Rhodanobacteraceae bacterium]
MPRERTTSGLRVLVVEDEVMLALLLQGWLESMGCLVTKAGRLSRAMALIESEAFHFAFVDVNLGGEESYPLVRGLDQRQIPFAFMSGYSRDMLQAEFRGRQMLPKPFQMHDVERVLHERARERVDADET